MALKKSALEVSQMTAPGDDRPKRRRAAAVPATTPRKAEKKAVRGQPTSTKVIRDSFTMPAGDYAILSEVKAQCLEAGVAAKKSEILRAGLLALKQLSLKQVTQILSSLEPVKTGRPSEKK